MTSAEFLFEQFVGRDPIIGPVEDYAYGALPQVKYTSIQLSDLAVQNPKNANLEGSIVWFPAGQIEAVKKIQFNILTDSPNNTFYFIRVPRGTTFRLHGPGHEFLNMNETGFKMMFRMGGGPRDNSPPCKVIVGQRSFCAGAEAILINTTMLLKKNSLWSDRILIQGTNQHGIVDLDTMSLVDYPRNRITLEPHVWIGRDSVLCAGAHIGAGSIVGTGALVANKIPRACIVGGRPARVIKTNRTWADSMRVITDDEVSIIQQYVLPDEPARTSQLSGLKEMARSIWVKAALAGGGGAAAYEGLTTAIGAAL